MGGNAHADGAAGGAGSMLAAGMAGLAVQDGNSRAQQQGVKTGGTALPVDPFSQGARFSADGVAVLQQPGSSSSNSGTSASSCTPPTAAAAGSSADQGKTDASGQDRADPPGAAAAEASVRIGAQLQGGCSEAQLAVLSGLVSVLGPGVMDAWAKLEGRVQGHVKKWPCGYAS